MYTDELWERFVSSGRINDYLKYCENIDNSKVQDKEITQNIGQEKKYAGFSTDDGNGDQGRTYWRV